MILKGFLVPNTWASQQHKNLKLGSREPVASKKMTLGQVVPNFTGQVVTGKITQKEMHILKKLIVNLYMTIMSNFM